MHVFNYKYILKTKNTKKQKNTKVKVRSPDEDTNYFDRVASVLQGDTLAPYLFIICLDYVLENFYWYNER